LASAQFEEALEQGETVSLTLLWVKLSSYDVVSLDHCRHGVAVVGAPSEHFGCGRPVLERVDEVEDGLAVRVVQEDAVACALDGVPADMRHAQGRGRLESDHFTGDQVETLVLTVLEGPRREQLHS
jgi:hypothetical protein